MTGVAGEPPDDHVVRDRVRGGGVGFQSAFDHGDHDLVVTALSVNSALTRLVEAVVAVAV